MVQEKQRKATLEALMKKWLIYVSVGGNVVIAVILLLSLLSQDYTYCYTSNTSIPTREFRYHLLLEENRNLKTTIDWIVNVASDETLIKLFGSREAAEKVRIYRLEGEALEGSTFSDRIRDLLGRAK